MTEKVEPLHTYEIEFFCQNCNTSQKEKIAKGKLAIEHDFVCKKCGCSRRAIEEGMQNFHKSLAKGMANGPVGNS